MPNKYIFNVSFYMDPSYFSKWESWIERELFPLAGHLNPGNSHEVFEVLSGVNQGMKVFSVQFICKDEFQLDRLQKGLIPLFNLFKQQFGEEVTYFESVLKKVQ
ncbi:DUF4286 family protein [Thermophagus xiamenensis]|uniref:DUF4286 domain-containing protein n=1 Tax=Thermophagus xiamenensis TaxID=385682 RepID=A0A1I1ZKW2_9BACT|nr:DUF4286 family protein [Thermophagus xiamenensis]SFE32341.1 protein of unknown function [Thermophagus xiamenensis]